jgi:hypothetical protein
VSSVQFYQFEPECKNERNLINLFKNNNYHSVLHFSRHKLFLKSKGKRSVSEPQNKVTILGL